jgi:hypothetical protein
MGEIFLCILQNWLLLKKDPEDEIIQSGKWRGYTVKESREIKEIVKKEDEERLKKIFGSISMNDYLFLLIVKLMFQQ